MTRGLITSRGDKARSVRRGFLLGLFLTATACNLAFDRDSQEDNSSQVAPEPVAECVAYESALSGCHHHQMTIANQPSLIPHTVVEREHIRAVCNENMQRLRVACR